MIAKILAFFLRPVVRIPLLILSLLLYLLTIIAAYGGRFNPDLFSIPGSLTLLLPYFAIASVVVTIIWFLIRGYLGGCLGVLAIIVSWGPVSVAVPLNSPKKPTPGAETFTVLSWNMIHGWDLEKKTKPGEPNRSIQYLLDQDADIVVLQELNSVDSTELQGLSPAQIKNLHDKYPYISGVYDMRVLSKFPMLREPGYRYIDGDYDKRRYTFYKINLHGHLLTLINMHLLSFRLSDEERDVVTDMRTGVSGMKKSWNMLRTGIREKLRLGFKTRKKDVAILRNTLERVHGPLIICGDFNDVPESYAYRLLRGDDLRDAYVETGFGPLITYNRHAFWVHLDQVFYRGDLKALSVIKGTLKVSDHYPLLTTFEFTDGRR
ncbi:MAG: endonuclease/exonuclease/phosphatase family protein [Muribaculaceae bacterium]|nr:endonuclease/exonuclease/phosphatase family protein [Muribaculaceae bacterium]